MKYFKLFLTVCAMAVAISASAQSKTTAKSKTATSTAKTTTAAPAKKATTTTAKPAAAAPKAAAKPATTTKKTTTTTTAKAAAKPAKETKSSEPKSYAASDFDPRCHLMLETKIGATFGPTGGWGENIVLEKEFNKYIAVDFFSIDFSTNFGFDFFDVGLKVGARGFSPSWWGGKMRAYGSLAMGYDCAIVKGQEVTVWGITARSDTEAFHGFGLSAGAGVQIVQHVFVGYAFEYSTAWKSTAHFARIGVRF